MRAVVQRVVKASVSVGDEVVSSIGHGLCVLIGISRDDTRKDIEYMVRKVLNLRVFEDDEGKRWNKSVTDKHFEVLCISQFTLYCTLKGNKPDYHLSMGAEQSEKFYKEFLEEMGNTYSMDKIKDGRFGALMQVNIQNDGPVTIQLESPPSNEKGKPDRRQQKGQSSQKASNREDMSAEGAAASSGDNTDTTSTQPANS